MDIPKIRKEDLPEKLREIIGDNDAEFDGDLNATKAQIKRAFAKSLNRKKMNKKILGEFIELVA